MAVLGTRVSGFLGQQWAGLGAGIVFRLLRPVAATTPLHCGRNTVLLRVFLVIWIHAAIVAGCDCGARRNRNIAAASTDAFRNLKHFARFCEL